MPKCTACSTMRRLVLIGFVVCAITPRARSQWILLHTDADSLVQQGIRHIFNLKYDSAQSLFDTLTARYPRHPAGYFFSAMVDWWHIAVDPDNRAWDRSFASKLKRTEALCDSLLDSNEFDIIALFFKGGAVGYLGELYAYREQWVAAAQEGKRGLDILQRAEHLAPTNYDVMLGTGLYNYYAEKIPEDYPWVKPFLLFFPSGNKRLGMQQLRAAAVKGRYTGYEAYYQLLRIYYSYENDFPAALGIARVLHAEFPDNVLFERFLGRCLAQLSKVVPGDSVWRDVAAKCTAGRAGYGASAEREARYYIGLYAMNAQRYDEALSNFYICDSLSRPLDTDGPSGFMTMTNLRIGMIFDLQEKRPYALQQYDKVLSWKDFSDAHDQASRYKARAYGH